LNDWRVGGGPQQQQEQQVKNQWIHGRKPTTSSPQDDNRTASLAPVWHLVHPWPPEPARLPAAFFKGFQPISKDFKGFQTKIYLLLSRAKNKARRLRRALLRE
jgi:hypothetical protein